MYLVDFSIFFDTRDTLLQRSVCISAHQAPLETESTSIGRKLIS